MDGDMDGIKDWDGDWEALGVNDGADGVNDEGVFEVDNIVGRGDADGEELGVEDGVNDTAALERWWEVFHMIMRWQP